MTRIDPKVRRQSIINVALQLFKRDGFDAVRIDDILRETGLSKGGFYHYFKSREDILRHIVIEETSRLVSSLNSSVIVSDPLAALSELFLKGSSSLGAETGVLSTLDSFAARIVYLDELERQLSLHLKPYIVKVIEQGVSTGIFREVDSIATAEMLMAVNDHGNRCAVLDTLDKDQLQAYNRTGIEVLARHLGVEGALEKLLSGLQ